MFSDTLRRVGWHLQNWSKNNGLNEKKIRTWINNIMRWRSFAGRATVFTLGSIKSLMVDYDGKQI